MQAKRFNILPHRFLHRGISRRVRRVERSWDVSARPWRRPGHYFRVRCHDDTRYDLFHDVALNTWYVKRPRSFAASAAQVKMLGRGRLTWTSI